MNIASSSPLRCCSDISKFLIMFSLFFGRPQAAAAGKQPVHVTTPCHSEVVVVPMARAGAEAAWWRIQHRWKATEERWPW
jgi:hypothetical protein